jgi:hypothetical protein
VELELSQDLIDKGLKPVIALGLLRTLGYLSIAFFYIVGFIGIRN